ncbi:GSU2403 family nucleotidyltransferase fold protein [Denitromonas ohlonensis]
MVPAPARLAVHNLIFCGERPGRERTKSAKKVLQSASLISYFLQDGQAAVGNLAWREALARGKGWRIRALQGKDALLRLAPELYESRFGTCE